MNWLFFWVVCFVSLFSWTNSVTANPPVNKNNSFSFRIRGEPETLDWNRAHTIIESYLLMNLMEGLVAFDPQLKIRPALAQNWKISPDQKTYTFNLRPGVKWSDGVPLKAQDFVNSWKRLLSPLTAASYAYLLFDIEGAEAFYQGKLRDFTKVGIRALDDLTFQVTLIRPIPQWISIPAFWTTFPIRQDLIDQFGTSWTTPGRMVTLGAFLLQSQETDTKIVLRANPNYYGSHGNLDQINAFIVKDDTQALERYENGTLDFLTDLGTVNPKSLKGRPDIRTFPRLKTTYLAMVVEKYPVSNTRIRRAIALAIDKKKICELLPGGQTPASSFIPAPLLGYSSSLGLPFDPVQARKELQASGMNLGQPLSIEYVAPNWDKSKAVARSIEAQLKNNLGITVTVRTYDNPSYRNQLELQASGLYEASWTADFPDPDNFLSIFMASSGNSRTKWKNPSFDELIQKARHETLPSKREKIYTVAQKILLDEAVIIPLYFEPNLALLKKRVQNFEVNPMEYLYLKNVSVTPSLD